MKAIPEDLLRTEDAVETLGGLMDILRCVHDVETGTGRCPLHNQVGYLMNVIEEKISAARRGYESAYIRYWREQARGSFRVRRRRRDRRLRNAR